ncbi:hypothetical protein Vretimale_89, partial [Volvox reticuliferus]
MLLAGAVGSVPRVLGNGPFPCIGRGHTRETSLYIRKPIRDGRTLQLKIPATGNDAIPSPEPEDDPTTSISPQPSSLPARISRAFLSGVFFATSALRAGESRASPQAVLAALATAITVASSAASAAHAGVAAATITSPPRTVDPAITQLLLELQAAGPPPTASINIASGSVAAMPAPSLSSSKSAAETAEARARMEAALRAVDKLVQAAPDSEEARRAAREAAAIFAA